MKRYIKSSSSVYTSPQEAQHLIDSINMTRGRRESLENIQEWNVSPEDAAVLMGKDWFGMIRFNGPRDLVVSVSYGPEHPKADKTFILEYEDGSRRLYGWDEWISSRNGSVQRDWIYLKRV